MASLNVQVRHRIRVTKVTDGSAYTGLVNADFTKTLRRMSGNTFVSASETVTVTEINAGTWPGMYLVAYTPTSASEFYTVDLSGPADAIIDVPSFQDAISGAAVSSTGPYLTTRDAVKLAIGETGSAQDATIDQMLPAVTAIGENYCNRPLIEDEVTEFLDAQDHETFTLKSYPVTTITSVHHSTGTPRVYDATTLLTVATQYIFDSVAGIVRRVDGSLFACAGPRRGGQEIKVVATVGYATIPADLELGAIIWITAILPRFASGGSFHLASLNRGDGSITFDTSGELMRTSIPPAVRALWDPFRVFARAA